MSNESWLHDEQDDYEEKLDMIEECVARDHLSDWNRKFINSINEQFTDKRWMSQKQYEILRRIYHGR